MEYKYKKFAKMTFDDTTYDDWKKYREYLAHNIIERIEGDCESIIIWGAGPCNDIDLQYFVERFKQVILIDIDADAMLEGIKKQHLEGNSKIKTIQCDFLGIGDSEYKIFEDMLIKKESAKKVIKYIRNLASEVATNDINLILSKKQISVCIGVHSQLLAQFIGTLSFYCENYSRKEIKKIYNEFIYMCNKICKRLNEKIINLSTDRIFMGFDITEFSEARNNVLLLKAVRLLCQKGKYLEMENILKPYYNLGAFEGRTDMFDRVTKNNLSLITTLYIIWPFSSKKQYLLTLHAFEK